MSALRTSRASAWTGDIRRLSLLLKLPLLIVAALGCSESQPVATSPPEASIAAHSLSGKAVEHIQELSRLTAQAREYEEHLDFDAAAGTWKTFTSKVVKQFGPESWQARNAEFAYTSAIEKSGFDSSQRQQLKQIRQWNEQIKKSVAGNEINNALELSQDVKQLQSELFGEDSIEVGQSFIQIATLESRLGCSDRAISNFHQGIKILAQRGYTDHPELEMAHAGLASAYSENQKYAPAVANQKVATQISGRIWGLDSLNFATQANQLGVIYHRAGNLDVAFNILSQAKLIRQQALGTKHMAYAHSCLNLGVVMLDLQRLADAEACLVESLAIFERELGSDHPLTIRCKSQFASLHMLRKQPELAEPTLNEIVNSMTHPNDLDDKSLLSHQYRLAVALAQQGKYDRAQPLIEQVIEKQQSLFGASDRRTISSMRAYASMLQSTHQKELAAQVNQQINRVAHVVDANDFQRR